MKKAPETAVSGAWNHADSLKISYFMILVMMASTALTAAAVGLPVFGVVPYDPVLGRCDTEGKSLLAMPEDAASVKPVKKTLVGIMGFEV